MLFLILFVLLNNYSGSGFISSKYYDYGFFSAKIKLPGEYTAGVVVAFYVSTNIIIIIIINNNSNNNNHYY